ncbi:extracellular solute-binding protein family 1, partial [mine drainage metagenome]
MKKRTRFGVAALGAALAVSLAGATGGAIASASSAPKPTVVKLRGATRGVTLTLMYGSSGPAETAAVNAAAAAWSKSSGNKVNVINASNLNQQLDQGFAGGNPPDVFYLSSSLLETFAKQGDLLPYASKVAPASVF